MKFHPLLRFFLFLSITLVATTLAGAEWMTGNYWVNFGQPKVLGMSDFWRGFQFSIPFLGVLTIHEFGHYIFAKKYKADVTLPLYIPAWLGFIGWPSIGTMGAFIRLKTQLTSRKAYFDVGVAGPLAGFVAALLVLWYGFTHLPTLDYLFSIHPEYKQYGANYAEYVYKNPGLNIKLGTNLVFQFFERFVVEDKSLIPNGYEMMHYPYLFAGFLALFFTALNLLPIGQLDGGHILFSVAGARAHSIISPMLFVLFVFYAGLGSPMPIDYQYDAYLTDKLWENLMLIGMTYVAVSRMMPETLNNFILAFGIFGIQYALKILFPGLVGNSGWLVFAIVLGRFLGIYHPPTPTNQPLTAGRIAVAIVSLLVFVVCFSPAPFGQ